jgi:hypothetical protein
MKDHISILQGYIDHLEYMKKNADVFFDRDQADRDIEAFKAAIEALEQEPCPDAISRQAVMNALCDGCELFKNGEQTCFAKCEEYHFLATLPLVNPQEPKTGHWIISPNDCFATCSECGLHGDKGIFKHYRWCPICGAKMIDPQESEG